MALASLIAITIVCIAWSLWIRRVTWSCRWEVAATLNIALQGARGAADVTAGLRDRRALAVRPHRQVEPRGLPRPRRLHRRGIGDRLQRAGQARTTTTPCRVVQAVRRAARRRCASRCCWRRSRSATAPRSTGRTSSTCPTDFWLNTYWLLLCGTLIYLLGYGSRALLVLRKDPRSRRIANIYLFASAMRHPGVRRAHHHGLRAAAADRRGQHTWSGSSPAVRRRLRADLGALLADQDEVVLEGPSLTPLLRSSGRAAYEAQGVIVHSPSN